MRKGMIVTLAAILALGVGLMPNKAQGLQHSLQYGANVGYSSVGFQLHGGSVEFLLGVGGKDRHRPQGSVIHVGFAGMTGTGESDLTKAKWNGASLDDYVTILAAQTPGFANFPAANQAQVEAGVRQEIIAGTNVGYGIANLSEAKGDGTAYIISATYEYVLSSGVPGLGILAGAELYISQGGFKSSNSEFPSVKTKGGIGGGGVVGVGYYLRNGINFSFKTGLGAVDPGEVTFTLQGQSAKVEPETVFYATPTFSIGYIY